MAIQKRPKSGTPIVTIAPADEAIPKEVIANWVNDDRRLAMDTKNPLYIWQAILTCQMHDIPLPDWCLDHIRTVAINLSELMHGRRPSRPQATIKRNKNESENDFTIRRLSEYNQRDFPPDRAIERLGEALMVTHQGWNAFVELDRDSEKIKDAGLFLAQGESAKKRIVARRNLGHERSARRRILLGKKLMGIKSGPNKGAT